jgi:uncharacterized phiE125 gp8 family phage protein
MTPILISGPAVEPVSLAEAKQWLRIDNPVEDDLVGALVTSARLIVESATRRMLVSQTWRLVYDQWPGVSLTHDGYISRPEILPVPFAPFQRVAAIRVYDVAGVAQTLPSSAYAVDATPDRARIVFTVAPPTPGRVIAGIEVDIVVGYGDAPTSSPESLRLAIKLLAARWFENRGDVETDASADRLPGVVGALVAPFRRARLS